MVKCLTLASVVRVWAQHEAKFVARFLCCLDTLFVKQCFGNSTLQRLSVSCGSKNNRLREREIVEWMVCHSDRSIFIRYNYLQLSTFGVWVMRILHQKNLDVPFWQVYECLKLCLSPVMYSTTSAVLHYPALQHQCRIVTCVASLECFI